MEWVEQKIEMPDAPPGTRTLLCKLESGDEVLAVCSRANGLYALHVAYRAAAVCAVCGSVEEGHRKNYEEPPPKTAHGYLPRLARWPSIEEVWDALDRLVPKGRCLFAALISQVDHEADATVRVFQMQEAVMAPPAPKARRKIDG